MKSTGKYLLVVYMVSACVTSFSQQKPVSMDNEIRILSWNIYMLPWPVIPSGKIKRAREIVHVLREENYDILVLQEAFHRRARWIIRRGLKDTYPYRIGPANRKLFSLKTHSGVWMLSRIPLKELKQIRYKQCRGTPDCMARKGALLAEADLNGHKFQVLGTHIQSVPPNAVKQSQYTEMKALLDEFYHDSIPQILAGDFNIGKGREGYAQMLQTLSADDYDVQSERKHTISPENDFRGPEQPGRLIDFIFYRCTGKKCSSISRNIRRFTSDWSTGHKDLSDHFAAEAILKF